MARLLLAALLLAAVSAVAYKLFSGRGLFVIQVRRDGIRLRGEVPGRRRSDVLEFISSLRLRPGAVVRGLPAGRRFRLAFTGVPAGVQQQIRNYLYL